jgi:hypothetical protein
MKLIPALLMAFACSGALADTPLFDFSPTQLRPQEVALGERLAAKGSVSKVNAINLNRAAFQDSVITVSVNNKIYKFTGKVERYEATPTTMTWSGGNGKLTDRLTITEDTEAGINGYLVVDGLEFTIHGQQGARAVLVLQRKTTPAPLVSREPEPAAAAILQPRP